MSTRHHQHVYIDSSLVHNDCYCIASGRQKEAKHGAHSECNAVRWRCDRCHRRHGHTPVCCGNCWLGHRRHLNPRISVFAWVLEPLLQATRYLYVTVFISLNFSVLSHLKIDLIIWFELPTQSAEFFRVILVRQYLILGIRLIILCIVIIYE